MWFSNESGNGLIKLIISPVWNNFVLSVFQIKEGKEGKVMLWVIDSAN